METGKFDNEQLLGDTVRMRNAGRWDSAGGDEPTALYSGSETDATERQSGEGAAEPRYCGEAGAAGGPGEQRAEQTEP